MVVAHKSNTEEIGILRKVFQNYDTNKSGDITYVEFVAALASTGYSEEQLKPIFEAVVSCFVPALLLNVCVQTSGCWCLFSRLIILQHILLLHQDIDGSGRIRYTEFLAATMELHGAIREELLAEAFDRLDSDDSG